MIFRERTSQGRDREPEVSLQELQQGLVEDHIVFMVAAPMMQRGIKLELPQTRTAANIEEARVVVSIDREGRIRINERPVHADLLRERMKMLAASQPDETVFLRADKTLPYGEVLLVMDPIRTAGMTQVSLVTVPLEIVEGTSP